MRLGKKSKIGFLIISICFLVVFMNQYYNNNEKLVSENIKVNVVYYNKTVLISYDDKTNMTRLVTLEIEGLTNSFQKNFTISHFRQSVSMPEEPQYGWKTVPVTFLVNNDQYGKMLIKTEITPFGKPPAAVIYGRP